MSKLSRQWYARVSKLSKRRAPNPRCPLVNPLCPQDLCILDADHPGTLVGWHTLEMAPDDPWRCVYTGSAMFLHPDGPGTPDNVLIRAGKAALNQKVRRPK